MTNQEYYDKLVCAALDGTFPSYDENQNICMYRHGNHRCAVGILIPDEEYSESMEKRSADTLVENGLFKTTLSKDILQSAQYSHDDSSWDYSAENVGYKIPIPESEFRLRFFRRLNDSLWTDNLNKLACKLQ